MSREKLIYIASPYAGDIETNTAFAKKACWYAIHQGHTPIAVHLLYPQMLDDAEPTEREIGLRLGHRVLEVCDELWLCGGRVSSGRLKELMPSIPCCTFAAIDLIWLISPPSPFLMPPESSFIKSGI